MEAETTAFEGPLPPNYQPWNTGSSLPSSVQTNQQQMATTFNAEGSGLYGHVSRHQMHWQSPAAAAVAQAAESAVAQYSAKNPKTKTSSSSYTLPAVGLQMVNQVPTPLRNPSAAVNAADFIIAEGSGLFGHASGHQMHWQSPAAEAAAQAAESAVAQYSEMHAKDGKEGGLRSSSAAPLGATMPAAALLTTSTSLGPVTAHLKLAQSSLAKGPSHH